MDIESNKCYTNSRKKIPYEELTLSNDFLFCKVMQDKALCKHLLELILDCEIEDIVYQESQKVFDDTIDGKSIRLDVYIKDDKHTIYDIEMQTSNTKDLPKRSRYYHSCIDRGQVEKGQYYGELKERQHIPLKKFVLKIKNYFCGMNSILFL